MIFCSSNNDLKKIHTAFFRMAEAIGPADAEMELHIPVSYFVNPFFKFIKILIKISLGNLLKI